MLQDEVDYLREKADQATRLQAAVDSFKRKAEELNALKLKGGLCYRNKFINDSSKHI